MNPTEALEVLDEPTSNRKALKGALIALDEYVGHTQDRLADLRLHAAAVVARTADEEVAAGPPTADQLKVRRAIKRKNTVDPMDVDAAPEATPVADLVAEGLEAVVAAAVAEPAPERSPLDLSAAAFVAAMKSRSTLDLAAQLAYLSEGFDFTEVAEALLGATGKKRTPRKTSLDFARAAGVVFFFTRKGFASTASIAADGSVTVLAGSTVSLSQSSGPKTVAECRDRMIASGAIDGAGLTAEDATFPTSSAAASFVCGIEINGPTSWSTPAGFNINEHCDEEKGRAKADALAVRAAKAAARAAAKEAKELAKIEKADAKAAAKLDAAAEKVAKREAKDAARKAAKAAKVAAKVLKVAADMATA